MNPGTLVYDPNFTFRDGVTGQKILAVLNDGACGYYIVVKMTSRPAYKGTVYGCQNNDRYPNFFCPRGSCRLSKDTWIQLEISLSSTKRTYKASMLMGASSQ